MLDLNDAIPPRHYAKAARYYRAAFAYIKIIIERKYLEKGIEHVRRGAILKERTILNSAVYSYAIL